MLINKAEPCSVFKDHSGEGAEVLLPQELDGSRENKAHGFPFPEGSEIPIFIPLSSVCIYSQMRAADTELY